jgi:hypothetical protein
MATVGAALLIFAAASAAPAAAFQCPAVAGQTLVYIAVFDGPPERQVSLAPDQSTPSAGGKTANVWDLQAGADGLYVTCGYGKKLEGPYSRMETIRLPDTVKTCRAAYLAAPGTGSLALTRFSCK